MWSIHHGPIPNRKRAAQTRPVILRKDASSSPCFYASNEPSPVGYEFDWGLSSHV